MAVRSTMFCRGCDVTSPQPLELACHADRQGAVVRVMRDVPGTGFVRVSCGRWTRTSSGLLEALVA